MLADDGSCVEHGIPRRNAKGIVLPLSYKARIDAQTYHMLRKQGGYSWLVLGVKVQLHYDSTKAKFTDDERDYSKFLSKNNVACHAIAQEILDVLIKKQMFDDNAIDDAGGRLPHGVLMRPHGGVFALSMDRIENDRPHFLKDKPVTANLNLVAGGMNNHASIVGQFGGKTCEVLRAKVVEQHSDAVVEGILNRAKQKYVRRDKVSHILYRTCSSTFSHEKVRYKQHLKKERMFSLEAVAAIERFQRDFPTKDSLFQHVLHMYQEQNARCTISGILMDNAMDAPDWFKPSLDAIEPRKGHVKGNLRLICRFLNSTNNDKKKTHDHADDPESMWTRESFLNYIGVV